MKPFELKVALSTSDQFCYGSYASQYFTDLEKLVATRDRLRASGIHCYRSY